MLLIIVDLRYLLFLHLMPITAAHNSRCKQEIMAPTLTFLEWKGSWFPPNVVSPLCSVEDNRFREKPDSKKLGQPVLGGCRISVIYYSSAVIITIMLTSFCPLSIVPKEWSIS